MRHNARALLGAALLVGLLGGCGAREVALPTTTPRPATATPAPTAGIVVNITGVPTIAPHPTPRPSPTPFRRPSGAYLIAAPSSGPPASRTVTVVGGNLPISITVDLVWSPTNTGGSVSAGSSTDKHGNLSSHFTIPAAQPGYYRITAYNAGTLLAAAPYRVISRASVAVNAQPTGSGDRLRVRGRRFLAHTHLVLVAYPLFHGQKALVLGKVSTNRHGAFASRYQTRKLAPGAYELRAYSSESEVAQTVSTYFQVEL